MDHWDHSTCQAFKELGFGSTLLMSGLALGSGLMLAFGLGVI